MLTTITCQRCQKDFTYTHPEGSNNIRHFCPVCKEEKKGEYQIWYRRMHKSPKSVSGTCPICLKSLVRKGAKAHYGKCYREYLGGNFLVSRKDWEILHVSDWECSDDWSG